MKLKNIISAHIEIISNEVAELAKQGTEDEQGKGDNHSGY